MTTVTRRYGPIVLTVLTLFVMARFAPSEEFAERAVDDFGTRLVRLASVGIAAPTPGSALTGWAESSVVVQRTGAKHSSRPSSFGSHLSQPVTLPLYTLTSLNVSDEHGCNASSSWSHRVPKHEWAALVQRGRCSFSQKARFVQSIGATVLLFGDQSESEGGVPGGGLLTPWSPDDTGDITIPSSFVARSSYLSILATFEAEQKLPSSFRPTPEAEAGAGADALPRGLVVSFSKDEIFAWPFLDLLLMLLFLPTLLTMLTVFTHRLRLARQRKAERAPREAIEGLRVFAWQTPEKPTATSETATEQSEGRHDDEEAAVETTPLLTAGRQGGVVTAPLTRHWHIPRFFLDKLPFVRSKRQKVLKRPYDPNERAEDGSSRAFVRTSECAICLSDFEKGELVMELPCGHWFHKQEIVPWLAEQRGVCPVCRSSIVASEPTTPSVRPASGPLPVPLTRRLDDSNNDQDELAHDDPPEASGSTPSPR